jgi:chemotaxis protein CheD
MPDSVVEIGDDLTDDAAVEDWATARDDVGSGESVRAGEEAIVDVFLGPGDLYFGNRATRIRTLLGSCVAVTLWHPGKRIGGMCHYVVPCRGEPTFTGELNGRYADEAMEILLGEICAAGTSPRDYQAKMFGGGSQFTDLTMNVATRNVAAGLELLGRHGLTLASMHFGGTGHRQVVLEVATGDVWVRHVARADE